MFFSPKYKKLLPEITGEIEDILRKDGARAWWRMQYAGRRLRQRLTYHREHLPVAVAAPLRCVAGLLLAGSATAEAHDEEMRSMIREEIERYHTENAKENHNMPLDKEELKRLMPSIATQIDRAFDEKKELEQYQTCLHNIASDAFMLRKQDEEAMRKGLDDIVSEIFLLTQRMEESQLSGAEL